MLYSSINLKFQGNKKSLAREIQHIFSSCFKVNAESEDISILSLFIAHISSLSLAISLLLLFALCFPFWNWRVSKRAWKIEFHSVAICSNYGPRCGIGVQSMSVGVEFRRCQILRHQTRIHSRNGRYARVWKKKKNESENGNAKELSPLASLCLEKSWMADGSSRRWIGERSKFCV